MRGLVIVLLALTAVSAVPRPSARIVGGTPATINQYPMMASLLYSRTTSGHRQSCGGVIINNRSILTAASCTFGDANARWRSRVGSTNANGGGSIYNTNRIANHPQYNAFHRDHDIAIIRISGTFRFSTTVYRASLPRATYHVLDNQIVWATGWGTISYGGPASEQLRQVQMWTVNQITCRNNYSGIGRMVTDNMICAGHLNVGGRAQCTGDNGGPLFHNGIVVGVYSWGQGCGLPAFPSVNTRVPRYEIWISQNQ